MGFSSFHAQVPQSQSNLNVAGSKKRGTSPTLLQSSRMRWVVLGSSDTVVGTVEFVEYWNTTGSFELTDI